MDTPELNRKRLIYTRIVGVFAVVVGLWLAWISKTPLTGTSLRSFLLAAGVGLSGLAVVLSLTRLRSFGWGLVWMAMVVLGGSATVAGAVIVAIYLFP